MQFLVKDGTSGLPIAGATVVVSRDSDNSSVFSGTTDANGAVDFNIPAGVAHSVLAYKSGSYDGVKVSIVDWNGVLYPSAVLLLKVASRTMKLDVFLGNYSTPLSGARVEVLKPDGTSFLVATTGSDGKYQTVLQADLAGWVVSVTSSGLDGVEIPLDKIDLVGEVRVVLSPAV